MGKKKSLSLFFHNLIFFTKWKITHNYFTNRIVSILMVDNIFKWISFFSFSLFFVNLQTFRHGFPHSPTALGYDPVQKLLAIGDKSGSLRMYPFFYLKYIIKWEFIAIFRIFVWQYYMLTIFLFIKFINWTYTQYNVFKWDITWH